jgi:hypothetical protein
MSTLDSYLFIAASTIGHDLAPSGAGPDATRRWTRAGLAASAVLAAGGAMLFTSAVRVWHDVGSVVTSALLLPVLAVNLPAAWRPGGRAATIAMLTAAATAAGWIVSAGPSGYPLGLEPMFPALAVALLCLTGDRVIRRIATI